MANSEHLHSAGAALAYSTNGSGYTALTDMRKIKAPPMQREDSKDTNLDSTNATDEYVGGWKRTGSATFSCYLTKAQFNTLLGTIYSTNPNKTSVYYWQLTYPKLSTEATASTLVWQGFIKSITPSEISIDSNDRLFVDIEITGSFGVTWTSGS